MIRKLIKDLEAVGSQLQLSTMKNVYTNRYSLMLRSLALCAIFTNFCCDLAVQLVRNIDNAQLGFICYDHWFHFGRTSVLIIGFQLMIIGLAYTI